MSKSIIITGSSSGVGLALGNFFQAKGYLVYGLSRSLPSNTNFKTIVTDITIKSEVKKAICQIEKETDSIDLLINNAARGMVGAIEDATEEEITDLFNLNLISVINMISEVLPIMRKNNTGKIINISSIGSKIGLPFRGIYSASKSSLDIVTEALRYELNNTNIQACTVNLGDVKTNIADSRIKSKVSTPYEIIFKKVYEGINQDVNNGFDPKILAPFLEKLLIQKSKLKPHYYFGSNIQKLSLFIQKVLPQKWFEKIITKYSGM
ncbi:SDR family NAD(P)-dependent oxidoreductase [Apibacter adventoris]|uniref:SDR family NAD(P)-dependent oxidoreductase n=1 Tax=Apibacter adventoris TaxID=1679466 RepID=UPI000CF6AD13|nr:SDR family NAD(P)-dependent oxidoreductase [Apibacter adventoris]PQL94969.1 short-chain dehydrogenase/reductase [Apibacter adventoris]